MKTIKSVLAKCAVFPILAVALVCSCATPSAKQTIKEIPLDDTHKQVIRQAKSAFVAVKQTYKDYEKQPLRDGPALPFDEKAADVLALAGIAMASSPATADITVSIEAEGLELAGVYILGGGIAPAGWPRTVAGSLLKGEITITGRGMTPIRRPFGGLTPLPSSVPLYAGPGPQFEKSFESSNLAGVLLAILGQADGIELLVKAADDSRPAIRRGSAWALGKLKNSATTETLAKLLQDPDEDVQGTAAVAFSDWPDPRATSLLAAALQNGSPKTKKIAAISLGLRRDSQAVDALVSQLADADWQVSMACANALGELSDPRAIDPLIKAMAREEPGSVVRYAAASALQKITGKDLGADPAEWEKWRAK